MILEIALKFNSSIVYILIATNINAKLANKKVYIVTVHYLQMIIGALSLPGVIGRGQKDILPLKIQPCRLLKAHSCIECH
jgi:hypothetical protein